MKKQIISAIVLAGMIASSSAFASRARNLVMGQGGADALTGVGYGSFYYEDAYNFFYNPAYVNDYKNFVVIEKDVADDAMFGFVTSMMNFNLGIFLNRSGGLLNPRFENPVEIMFGGDTGVKWGLGAQFQQAGSGATRSRELNLRAGASFNGLDPFVGYRAIGNNRATAGAGTAAADADYSGWHAGLRYHFGEWTPYAVYGTTKAEDRLLATEADTTTWLVGFGRETKLAEGARLAYALYYVNSNTDNVGGGVTTESNTNALPLNIGLEADATTWLTVRGGVNHTIVGKGGRTTTARLGGTFHMGKVDLDYAFGNDVGTGTGALIGSGAAVTEPVDSPNIGLDSSLFHQVALRYSW